MRLCEEKKKFYGVVRCDDGTLKEYTRHAINEGQFRQIVKTAHNQWAGKERRAFVNIVHTQQIS